MLDFVILVVKDHRFPEQISSLIGETNWSTQEHLMPAWITLVSVAITATNNEYETMKQEVVECWQLFVVFQYAINHPTRSFTKTTIRLRCENTALVYATNAVYQNNVKKRRITRLMSLKRRLFFSWLSWLKISVTSIRCCRLWYL